MALDFGKIKGKLSDYEKQEKENEKRITNDFVAFIDANNAQIERFIQEKFEEQAEEGHENFTITLFAKDNNIVIKFNHDNECIITKTFDYVIKDIIDEEGNSIDSARHPQMIVKLHLDKKVEKYDMMRIKMFDISDFM